MSDRRPPTDEDLRREMRHLAIATEQLRLDMDAFRSRLERIETSIDGRLSSISQSVIDIRAELAQRRQTVDQMNELRIVGEYVRKIAPRMMVIAILMVTILAAFSGAIVWQVASLSAQSTTADKLNTMSGQFAQRAQMVDDQLTKINERLSKIER